MEDVPRRSDVRAGRPPLGEEGRMRPSAADTAHPRLSGNVRRDIRHCGATADVPIFDLVLNSIYTARYKLYIHGSLQTLYI